MYVKKRIHLTKRHLLRFFAEVKARLITYLITWSTILKVFSVCLWLQIFQYFNRILYRNTKIGVKSLTYITSGRANKALENQEASVADKLKANLGNHGTNKKRQTTALDVTNKSMKMGMSSKKAVILQENKTKGSTHI